MGKKRKVEQESGYQVVVEESREPAAYTIGGQAQQQPQNQQQHANGHVEADEYAAGGYGEDAGGLLIGSMCHVCSVARVASPLQQQ